MKVRDEDVLDVATHLAASAGRDVPDYATAIDQLADLGVLPGGRARRLTLYGGTGCRVVPQRTIPVFDPLREVPSPRRGGR